MVVLDFFIVNVALPVDAGRPARQHAARSSGSSPATRSRSAALLITAGRLGDQFGRRRMFSFGLGLFTLALGGVRRRAEPERARRRAARAGRRAPRSDARKVLSIIGVAYTGADRVRALSVYGLVLGLAAVSGQLIGGVLVQADVAGLGWRSCFLINVPIGLAALALAPRVVPESRAGRSSRLDVAGTVLVTAGLTAIVLPLVEGRQHGWPLWTWVSLGAAPVLLGAFAVHQRRLGAPRRRRRCSIRRCSATRAFSAGLLTQLAFWAGQASFFLVLALYLQQGRGLDALNAGLVFTILAVAYLVASVKAPALIARFGRAAAGRSARSCSRPATACCWRRSRRSASSGSVGAARARAAARRRRHGPRHRAADDDDPARRSSPAARARRPAPCRRCRTSATRSAWRSPASSSSARSTAATPTRSS